MLFRSEADWLPSGKPEEARGSKPNARRSAPSSADSACTAAASREGFLGAEAIAHKPFVASLNERVSIGGT